MVGALIRNFGGSLAVGALGLAAAAAWGWHDSHALAPTLGVVWTVAVLAVLEVSLSFDNAVVNASVLETMSPAWQRRFLTWGMVLAVFGMRIAFPLAIVALTAHLGPTEALQLSLADPTRYAAILTGAHIAIAGFGGSFLLLLGLGFFLDVEKVVHWLGWLEAPLAHAAHLKAVEIGTALIVLLAIAAALPPGEALTFLIAGITGIVTFIAVRGAGHALSGAAPVAGAVASAGVRAFLYLEVLDASFSLDGVIGAFALSNSMVVIAIGLTIGAMFVRALTVLLVRQGALARYRFLEHGAFWAIAALGAIMLASTLVAIPETVTGLIGAVLIAAAVWSSWRATRRERAAGTIA